MGASRTARSKAYPAVYVAFQTLMLALLPDLLM
jgi:hypothetical protein